MACDAGNAHLVRGPAPKAAGRLFAERLFAVRLFAKPREIPARPKARPQLHSASFDFFFHRLFDERFGFDQDLDIRIRFRLELGINVRDLDLFGERRIVRFLDRFFGDFGQRLGLRDNRAGCGFSGFLQIANLVFFGFIQRLNIGARSISRGTRRGERRNRLGRRPANWASFHCRTGLRRRRDYFARRRRIARARGSR